MHPASRAAIAVFLLSIGGLAHAVKVSSVEIRGLDEELEDNVRTALSLGGAIGSDVTARRLGYMLRAAGDETREALEPFGYYSPRIVVERERDGARRVVLDTAAPPEDEAESVATVAREVRAGDGAGADSRGPVAVVITVEPGEPVRVRRADIAILGEGHDDRYLEEELDAFLPREGSIFHHPTYESSKTRISRRLAERGYFDADFSARRVEVTRADHAADIELVWTSGARYDMGATRFLQQPRAVVRNDLLERLMYWNEGDYYHQGRLDRLRTSLARLDYFSRIDIQPRIEEAVDGAVPVDVVLTPAKRDVYTAGLSYGTDSGPGVRLGLERRYVNDRGHKALAQLDYARKRKTLTLQYRIPAFLWLDGWYTASLQAADEQTDYIDTRRVEFVASRSGQYNRNLNLVAAVHALRERWAYEYEDDNDPGTPALYRYATFTYPSLRASYVDLDDPLFPRSGYSGHLLLRGGAEGLGSEASFAQVHARGHWYLGFGDLDRLILRGEFGQTSTSALVDMPPSLRFYAGGDGSVRGYEWREVGPRVVDADDDSFALGARHVFTASAEYEHYFRGSWGVAAFVDAGSAYDSSPDIRTGVGIGLRWRSPVGPLRLDIARGLDDPDSPFTLHLNIGADL
ncbi:autotransporter assembly complex family protein [Luteimonas sp. MC1825]|uniref:autotransporter assembly complex protein TamA n=1 Tax=Luteimonas sp. MC1825 TaxID=2761107 RepID=UPI0016213918|nr:autotransporter assembly complex family protein [Luteimonas sp. MC1825]MBB6600494.1 outer membrane protein assembly factor [Luteimonas sp. MC1825]QOC88156.1 outer membrane protein assembly factor [Luteimonas sp. MC1825]